MSAKEKASCTEAFFYAIINISTKGEMAERLKAQTWKVCILERVSRVRIPFSPVKKSLACARLFFVRE